MKVTLREYSNPKKPNYKWRVRFPKGDKTGDKLFKTKKEASAFLKKKKDDITKIGHKASGFLTPELSVQICEAVEKLSKRGKTINDAIEFYIAHLNAYESSKRIEELIPEFLFTIRQSEKSKVYHDDLSSRLGKFETVFGSKFASEITTSELSNWIFSINGQALTKNHYRRVIGTFFSWCKINGYCKENPVQDTPKMTVKPQPTEVFSPDELRAAISLALKMKTKNNKFQDVLAFLLIGAFGGLRTAEIQRLHWDQVKLDRSIIDLSGNITKTAARRFVKIQDVLFDWLKEYFPFEIGPVCNAGFQRRLKQFKAELKKEGIKWKHNALRHSYASYLLTKTQDAAFVSLQLGHNNSNIVFRHYRELVSDEDAREYWNLDPRMTLRGVEEASA